MMSVAGHGLTRGLATVLLALGASGCATGGVFSGPRDAFFDEAPYYATRGRVESAPVVHLRISYQRGATQPESFDPSAATDGPAAQLLAEMNAYLDSLGLSEPFVPRSPARGRAPDVQFGCERLPHDDCEDAPSRHRQRLAVANPSGSWLEWWRSETTQAEARQVLFITLEVGNYLPVQRDLLGRKEIRLGTNHTVDVPWLTATDRPASVLQLTGVLLDADGRVIRMGAEGLLARRTNLLVGALGAQRIISDEDVQAARTSRREDLPGSPLVWQAALRNMVAQLAALPELTIR
jgi:hypothetical protein